MPLIGGSHVVAATWKQLDADDARGFRQLTLRVEDNATTSVEMSVDGVNMHFYLKTDESLTFNNVGTVTPQEIWLKGTANDRVYFIGTPV